MVHPAQQGHNTKVIVDMFVAEHNIYRGQYTFINKTRHVQIHANEDESTHTSRKYTQL
jgi:hypothetical protein